MWQIQKLNFVNFYTYNNIFFPFNAALTALLTTTWETIAQQWDEQANSNQSLIKKICQLPYVIIICVHIFTYGDV